MKSKLIYSLITLMLFTSCETSDLSLKDTISYNSSGKTNNEENINNKVEKSIKIDKMLFNIYTYDSNPSASYDLITLPDEVVGKQATKVVITCQSSKHSAGLFAIGDFQTIEEQQMYNYAKLHLEGFDEYTTLKDVFLVGSLDYSPTPDGNRYIESIELNVDNEFTLKKNLVTYFMAPVGLNPYLTYTIYYND